MTTTPRQWEQFAQLRQKGWNRAAAARQVGINYKTAMRHEKGRYASETVRRQSRKDQLIGPTNTTGVGRPRIYQDTYETRQHPHPIPLDELSGDARICLNDFLAFQRRYFGRIATPWQGEAAEKVHTLLESPEKEYADINAPPGSGKSTTFTLDLPAWLTVRNRAIRGQMGSKTEHSARKYVRRLRRAFERTTPIKGEESEIVRGLALDAVATLADDFGSFRPEARDVWAADAFVVAQHGNVLIDEKEPTWCAYGMDTGFLGMRHDFIVWDDLVDKLVLRTVESRENLKEWWDDQAEKRLEPGGLLILQGQRMGPDDLYRYVLDKRVVLDDEDLDDEEYERRPQKYHHIVFKAHYDDRCQGAHKKDAPYYPEGCLLDPRRLGWRELKSEMANPRNNFAVIYQQEDVDPESVLVDPLWVTGGTDPRTHEEYPGCLDKTRDICQIPHGLFGALLSVATADPSPTKFWSIQWWVVRCVDGQPQERYLMDHIRQSMDAPSFLDWNNSTQHFSGVMEEWQIRSKDLGLPITTWIVEANAAQRFLLEYEHVRRWLAQWRVRLIPHQTQRNKSDPEYGVQTLAGIYKHGLVRLPWKNHSKGWMASAKLVEEVTHWPGWRSDDTVMAQWFMEWSLPHLIPRTKGLPRLSRPSWLTGVDTWGHRRGKVAV